jgi:hypothetical protein
MIRTHPRRRLLATLALPVVLASGGVGSFLLASCGPFTDVGALICPFVLELYYTGITAGTSSTTFSPNDPVTRGQMAIFIATTLDQSLRRGSSRAALNQWWTTTPQYASGLGTVQIGGFPYLLQADGADIWVADSYGGNVVRVRANDGAVLGTWTGATGAQGVLIAMGRVFISGGTSPGSLYMIDPTQPPGPVTTITTTTPLGYAPFGIAFDGANIWIATANSSSVSIVTPGSSLPWTSVSVPVGGALSNPFGLVFDGSNVWLTDISLNQVYKLDAAGAILQTVAVGNMPVFPTFDGKNIWVPNHSDSSVSVIAAATGSVLATLSGNGINLPEAVAFDGERVLVTNAGVSPGVSLWKAADLTPLGSFSTGAGSAPLGACSDGLNFWIALGGVGQIGKF